jgi:hypothetical protein
VNEHQPIWTPPIETQLVAKQVNKRRFLALFLYGKTYDESHGRRTSGWSAAVPFL